MSTEFSIFYCGNFYYNTVISLLRLSKIYIPLYSIADLFGYDVTYEKGIVSVQGEKQVGKKGQYEEKLEKKKITISAAVLEGAAKEAVLKRLDTYSQNLKE